MKRETKEQARRRDVPRVVLVGEANPYGGDPAYALYPAPDGCSGHRLCCLILGMRRANYLREFERVNLCPHEWDLITARTKAMTHSGDIYTGKKQYVLLGAKVTRAHGYDYSPFTSPIANVLVLPHPSGLSRAWNAVGSYQRARDAVAVFAPDLSPLLGKE